MVLLRVVVVVKLIVLSVFVIVNVICRCRLNTSVIVRCGAGAGAGGGVDTGRRLWRCCRVEFGRLPMIVVDGFWMSGSGGFW